MLVALESASILLLQDWKLQKIFNDPNSNNDFWKKAYLSPLPGFDEAEFPFIACSGSHSINIINLQEDSMEPLIIEETTCLAGQQAFFF